MNTAGEQLRRLGMSPPGAVPKEVLYARCDGVLDSLGSGAHRWSLWVPGRIEVLGKHTDYAGGRSLLCAVERGLCVRVAARKDVRIRLVDVERDLLCETALDPGASGAPGDWCAYAATVARRVSQNFAAARRGADIAMASDLPRAAGLSSSSALVVAVFMALAKSNDLRSDPDFRVDFATKEELAAFLGSVENGSDYKRFRGDPGVGTRGGSEDHTAILCCQAGKISLFAFTPVRPEAVVPLSPQYIFALGVSGVEARKTGPALAAYNRAALAARRVLDCWNESTGRADASLADAVVSASDAPDRLRTLVGEVADAQFTSRALRRRLEHFLAETYEIIPAATGALRRGAMSEFGTIVDRSHRLADELLENQVPQTMSLQRLARESGAMAASAFGAGFGGSVWALVARSGAHDFLRTWETRYRDANPSHAAGSVFFLSPPGPHAFQW